MKKDRLIAIKMSNLNYELTKMLSGKAFILVYLKMVSLDLGCIEKEYERESSKKTS